MRWPDSRLRIASWRSTHSERARAIKRGFAVVLKKKTIIVTGAASGIGSACVDELKRHGATVIGVDRVSIDANVDRRVAADLSDPRSITAAQREIGPGIDGLCNIAGLPPTAPPEDVLAVNALGLIEFTAGMIERMTKGASIVNLSSMAGASWEKNIDAARDFIDNATFDNLGEMVRKYNAVAAQSYIFSKEIVNYWTVRMHHAWIDRGIRMNSVCPGPIETPILNDFIVTFGERAEKSMRATERLGTPEDVVPVVAFLLSDEARWVRGVNISVDGGLSAHLFAQEFI